MRDSPTGWQHEEHTAVGQSALSRRQEVRGSIVRDDERPRLERVSDKDALDREVDRARESRASFRVDENHTLGGRGGNVSWIVVADGAMVPVICVTGTGTGIGKTLFSGLLVSEWGRDGRVLGFKPIETGGDEDGKRLEQVSTFHVTRFTAPYLLMDAVSPHLAARREGRVIEIDVVCESVERIRREVDGGLVIELPGGLFTPLSSETTNADLIRALQESLSRSSDRHLKVCLVAANRLGVLHDVIAAREAARPRRVMIDAIVLSDVEEPDASAESNLDELRNVLAPPLPLFARLLRQTSAQTIAANEKAVARLLAKLL